MGWERAKELAKGLSMRMAKKAASQVIRMAVRWLIALVGPIPLLVVLVFTLFIGAIFGVVSAGDYTGDNQLNQEDFRFIQRYKDATDKANPPVISWDKREVQYLLSYGVVYAIDSHANMTQKNYKMGDQWHLNDIAKRLAPKFQYKDGKVITTVCCPKGGCSTTVEEVKLLTVADTYAGIATFEWGEETVTYQSGECTVTITRPKLLRQTWKEDYTRFDTVLKDYCKLTEVKDLDRRQVLEEAKGVVMQRQYFEWLIGSDMLIPGIAPMDLPPAILRWWPYILKAAQETGVDPYLIAAVMTKESGGNPNPPPSPAGAIGLMQLLPSTAAAYGVDPYDPEQNILGGARVLAAYLRDMHGDIPLALAAYNWGPGNLSRLNIGSEEALHEHWNELPEETRNYIQTVLLYYQDYKDKAASGYVWPVQGKWMISQPFGAIQDDGNSHTGVDIAADMGTPVVAVNDGVITREPTTGNGGNQIWLHDKDGHDWYYAHLSSFAVQPGQSVTKGQVIGYVGSTGNSTGPHLHFGLWLNGHWVDPLQVVQPGKAGG